MGDSVSGSNGTARTSVIVLNYCGSAHIRACLESLLEIVSPPGGWSPIVIDNASTDDSLAMVRRHFPDIEIIASPRNVGYAGGNNLGIRRAMEAGADYVAILNMDTRVDASWLLELVKEADEAPDAAVLGSMILTGDGQEVEFDGRQFDPVTTAGGYAFTPFKRTERKPREAPYACGAAMLLRTEALKHVGIFDPTYFAYHEDVDLALRCWLHGYRVLLVPSSLVYHAGGGGGAGVGFRDFMGTRNSLMTILKVFDGEIWREHGETLVNHFLLHGDSSRMQAVLSACHSMPDTLRHRCYLRSHASTTYEQVIRRVWAAK